MPLIAGMKKYEKEFEPLNNVSDPDFISCVDHVMKKCFNQLIRFLRGRLGDKKKLTSCHDGITNSGIKNRLIQYTRKLSIL